MNTFFSLMAHGLLLMTVLLMLLQVRRWKQYWPFAYLVSAVVVVLPISNWLVIEFSRGYITDISFASLVMLAMYLLAILKPQRPINQLSFNLVILLFAILLYPASLGLTQFDPYALGFVSHEYFDYLILSVAIIGIIAAYIGYWQLALWLTLSCLGFGLHIYESFNLWNYLLDPLAVIACLVSSLNMACQKIYLKIFIGAKRGEKQSVQSNA